jgi:hypothetical protein
MRESLVTGGGVGVQEVVAGEGGKEDWRDGGGVLGTGVTHDVQSMTPHYCNPTVSLAFYSFPRKSWVSNGKL